MNLIEFDNSYRAQGFELLCGVDEAGRGPLAGPVFAASVILKPDFFHELVNDSKKLSEKKRGFLFDIILDNCVSYTITFSDANEIDQINILQATLLAMKKCVQGLSVHPDIILIDGNKIPDDLQNAQAIIKGDQTSFSIACASILAKVSRDRFMLEMAKKYPQYQFEKHKGYGTKLHYEMIDTHGICKIHRTTFLKKILEK